VQLERDHLFRESGGRKLERLVRDAYAWQIPHIYKQWLYTRAVMMHRLADALEIDFAVIFPTVYCENLGQRMWLTLYLIRKMHAALGANETYPTLSSNPSACWGWFRQEPLEPLAYQLAEDREEYLPGGDHLDWAVHVVLRRSRLTPRQRVVLQLRYGLGDDESCLTLREVGQRLNITVDTVRQIEARALRRLRHPYYSRELRVYL